MALQPILAGDTGAQAAAKILANDNELLGLTGKIPNWAAATYPEGAQVLYQGVLYELTSAATAGDVPGVSPKFLAKTGGGIPEWSAKIFAIDNLVFQNNAIYKANDATTATDVPGISPKWTLKEPELYEKNHADFTKFQVNTVGGNTASLGGTDFIPIVVGLSIYTNALGTNLLPSTENDPAGLAVFNASQGFIKHFDFRDWFETQNIALSDVYKSYTFTQADYDAGWRFFRCSFYGISGANALLNVFQPNQKLKSQESLNRLQSRHTDIKDIKKISRNVTLSGGTVSADVDGGLIITMTANGVLSPNTPDFTAAISETDYSLWYFLVEITILTITGGTTMDAGGQHRGVKVGDKVKLLAYNGNQLLIYNDLGPRLEWLFTRACSFKVNRAATLLMDNDYVNRFYMSRDIWPSAINTWFQYFTGYWFIHDFDWSVLDKNWSFADFSEYSRNSKYQKISHIYENTTYVSFGDSISSEQPSNYDTSYPYMVARYLGIKHLNLAVSGSAPADASGWGWNLSDANLALIPANVSLVTLTGGQNGWVTATDIASRVRTTSIGAINYAIDFIKALNPKAVIILITSPNNIGGNHADYVRIADYRKLTLIQIEKEIDWAGDVGVNVLRIEDNIHPTIFGQWRHGSIVLDTVKRYII